MVIVRRSPACLQQQDLSEFYKLARENPSMAQLSDFLVSSRAVSFYCGIRTGNTRMLDWKTNSALAAGKGAPSSNLSQSWATTVLKRK
jgi:hypothetical protein